MQTRMRQMVMAVGKRDTGNRNHGPRREDGPRCLRGDGEAFTPIPGEQGETGHLGQRLPQRGPRHPTPRVGEVLPSQPSTLLGAEHHVRDVADRISRAWAGAPRPGGDQ